MVPFLKNSLFQYWYFIISIPIGSKGQLSYNSHTKGGCDTIPNGLIITVMPKEYDVLSYKRVKLTGKQKYVKQCQRETVLCLTGNPLYTCIAETYIVK